MQRIDETISVGGMIRPADVAALAKAGFKAVLCNLPDGEGWFQPAFAEIEKAATAAGMTAAYLPAPHHAIGPPLAAEFGRTLDSLPKPVYAYCRSGARSGALWQMSRANRAA